MVEVVVKAAPAVAVVAAAGVGGVDNDEQKYPTRNEPTACRMVTGLNALM